MINGRDRYSRQLLIEGWGKEGQERLKASTVFIAGAGGLGSPVALYLASAGVGTILLCDDGKLEVSNLNRQVLYGEDNIGEFKVNAARHKLENLNSEIKIIPLKDKITAESLPLLASGADILIDCLDNFKTRYLLNRYTVNSRVPLIHGGVFGFSGQLTFINPPETPCLECLFPAAPEQSLIPVAGVTAGVTGSLEATEVLKYLLGMEPSLKGRLLTWEGDLMSFNTIELSKDPTCPACGQGI